MRPCLSICHLELSFDHMFSTLVDLIYPFQYALFVEIEEAELTAPVRFWAGFGWIVRAVEPHYRLQQLQRLLVHDILLVPLSVWVHLLVSRTLYTRIRRMYSRP